ncbi:MAG: AAA family ATPase, partial [Candidatus Thorarchaeota archaeon]
MIERINLRNFKVYTDQEFILHPGSTAIVGPNGSGKTSILEAIEFGLFRRVTRKEKKVPSLEDLINHRGKKARVELDFTAPINRREYTVIRQIHPGKKSAETTADLFLKGERKPEFSGPSSVDDQIVELLGMDRHAFSALTYVRQGEIDRLSRLSPRERRADLYSMMGFAIYDKQSSKIQKDMRQTKKELANLNETRQRLEAINEHLPSKEEVDNALTSLSKLVESSGETTDTKSIKKLIEKIQSSIDTIESQLASEEISEKPDELKRESQIAKHLRTLLDTIPDVAENQLRPHIRSE